MIDVFPSDNCVAGTQQFKPIGVQDQGFWALVNIRDGLHQSLPVIPRIQILESRLYLPSRSETFTDSDRLDTPTKRILSKIPLAKAHENIYTVPNILTFSRLVAAPLVGYLLVHDYHAAALSLFAYAGITDLVDGYIARRYQLQTVVGTIIDPMADKLLMTIGVACLAVNGSLPGKYWS